MKKILKFALATTLTVAFATPLAGVAFAKKRDAMSEKEKKALRKNAREYCNKKYAKGGAFVERIEIQSTGKVICWIRG
jgi:hypothetical protein